MATRQNKAAWLLSAKGRIEVCLAEVAMPERGEILIRAQATALQPVDAKQYKAAIISNFKYPSVIGGPVAGIVEVVGEGVTKVKEGDRVVSGTKIWTSGGVAKYGALQRFVVVDGMECIPIGDVDFATAVALASQTPPSALFSSGGLNLPFPPASPESNPAVPNGKKILIWGGSSAMGALSISYAKLAGYTVITTCSPHNIPYVISLGAEHVFSHQSPSIVSDIRALEPIHHIFDTISLPDSLTPIIAIIAGRREPTEILTLLPPNMPGNPEIPEGVKVKMHLFRNKAPENKEVAEWMLGTEEKEGYIGRAMRGGWIKGVPTENIRGLESVEEGLERLYKGVSCKKLVVGPWVEE